jgi:hypothetical protein
MWYVGTVSYVLFALADAYLLHSIPFCGVYGSGDCRGQVLNLQRHAALFLGTGERCCFHLLTLLFCFGVVGVVVAESFDPHVRMDLSVDQTCWMLAAN